MTKEAKNGFSVKITQDKKRERNRQFGNDFMKGAGGYVLGWLFFAVIALQLLELFFPAALDWLSPRDASDSATERSRVIVTTDHGTGCEYLRTRFGGIVPRMGADGQQVCGGSK